MRHGYSTSLLYVFAALCLSTGCATRPWPRDAAIARLNMDGALLGLYAEVDLLGNYPGAEWSYSTHRPISLSWEPSGRLAIASTDGSAVVYSPEGRAVKIASVDQGCVAVAWSNRGDRLAVMQVGSNTETESVVIHNASLEVVARVDWAAQQDADASSVTASLSWNEDDSLLLASVTGTTPGAILRTAPLHVIRYLDYQQTYFLDASGFIARCAIDDTLSSYRLDGNNVVLVKKFDVSEPVVMSCARRHLFVTARTPFALLSSERRLSLRNGDGSLRSILPGMLGRTEPIAFAGLCAKETN